MIRKIYIIPLYVDFLKQVILSLFFFFFSILTKIFIIGHDQDHNIDQSKTLYRWIVEK